MNHLADNTAEAVLAGDRRAVARAISWVENEMSHANELLRKIYSRTSRAYRIGITGPPGAGKSTLASKLALHYRNQGLSVGIVAVDPTSPFTGGALLGDRVRMTDVELDERVFIRSMASRGSLGGLSKKANEAADILDAAGFDRVLLETVGVGQSELDIAAAADTTIVVLVPESGDGIQAMKAGLMEIADLFVLNKADRPGADQAVMSIKMILGFKPRIGENVQWIPDILKTVAQEGKGVEDVAALVERHRVHQESSGELQAKRRTRLKRRIREMIDESLRVDFWNRERSEKLDEELKRILAHETTPFELVEQLLLDFREKADR